MLLNDCREDTSQEKGVEDIMACLGQMSLNDTVPDTNRRGTFGQRAGSPLIEAQSAHGRVSHIPRPYTGLSSRPSLMFLDRRYNGSGSESTSSCYSDVVNNARTGFSKIRRRPSPSPSFRSAPGASTPGLAAHRTIQNLRNSPWLRTAKSMHHMSAAAIPSGRFDAEMDISPPVSVMGIEADANDVGGDGPVPSRDHSSADSRRSSFDDPYVLVPKIIVTPESKTLEDGATGLWAAVQISTEIRPANASAHQRSNSPFIRGPSQLDVFRYGCLYDVSVEILPTESSLIVEVLKDKLHETNSTLYPGSRSLIIVHLKILDPPSPPGRVQGLCHVRESSDDLIQDLEHHLGNKVIEYLQIRIKYHHSSFPHQKYDQSADPDGTVEIQTAIETTARAAIKQHNSSSFWSPRPMLQANPLFEIIASHWGPGRAGEVMQRIINSHSTAQHTRERKPTPITKRLPMIPSGLDPREYRGPNIPTLGEGSDETLKQKVVPVPTRMPPPIPQRQASLQRFPSRAASNERKQTQRPQATDASPKTKTVWTEVRRTSGAGPNAPETPITQRSFMKSSVSHVPSAEIPGSPSGNAIRPNYTESPSLSRSKSTNAGKTGSSAAYSLRGSRLLNSRAPEQNLADMRHQQVMDSRNRAGEYSNQKTGRSNMDWAGFGDGTFGPGRSSQRVGNKMTDEERASRRQKMMLNEQQPATISVAGGRGSMGSLHHRGSTGGTGILDGYRHRQPPSSDDLYRAADEEMALGGQGRRSFDHQRNDGGGYYQYGESKAKKGGKLGTAAGRWGWAGWWP
ncbi:hypothetical protein V8F33_010785 [Rhypophila sp. PSN 637]